MTIQHLSRLSSLETNQECLRTPVWKGGHTYSKGKKLKVTSPLIGLIGRQHELSLLARFLQAAVQGAPQLLLIQGESGVGKTRLLKETRSLVSLSDAAVCYGRYYEDSALTHPLFIESLLADLTRVAEEGGPILEEEAKILKQLSSNEQRAPTYLRSASARPNQERLAVFFSITRAAIRIAQRRPLVLAIDDLQWADQLSLDLLMHLVFATTDVAGREPVSLFILGAYRPVEPHGRAGRVISRLQREDMCQTLEITGLNEDEVYEFVHAFGVERPAWQLVEEIHKMTHGNPLFIQEVLWRLITQEYLQRRGGYYVSRIPLEELNLPAPLTTAIAMRLQYLSGSCRKLLAFAAVLGESFSLPLLQEVYENEEAALLDLLEEGLQYNVLISQDQGFRFAHPMIRTVCYHGLSILRRQRLHLRAALVLERLGREQGNIPVLEITYHFIRAGAEAETEKVAQYARQAGNLAFSRSAWGEAARYYEAVLAAEDSRLNNTLRERAELHYLAGLAHYRNMDAGPALEQYEKAIACFHLADDFCGLGWALADKIHIYFTLASVPYGTLIDLNPLENTVENLGETELGLQGHLWATIAKAYWTARLPERTEPAARRALELGRQIDDATLCAESHLALALSYSQTLQLGKELESWQKSLECAQQAGDKWRQGLALQRIPMPLIGLGRLDEARMVALEACHAIPETQDWGGYSMALALLVFIDIAKGNFSDAEKRGEEMLRMANRSKYPWGVVLALPSLACMHAMRGEMSKAEQSLQLLVEPDCVFVEPGPAIQMLTWMYRQMLKARFGKIDTTWELCAKELLKVGGKDIHALAGYCAVVELSEASVSLTMAEAAYDALLPAVQQEIVFSSGWVFLLSRVLGVAATVNHWWDRAEMHFQAALETAENLGSLPELGRTYVDYARMLCARRGKSDLLHARELAQRGLALCQELELSPFTQHAFQLVEALNESYDTNDALKEALPDSVYRYQRGSYDCQIEEMDTMPTPKLGKGDNGNIFLREGDFWLLSYQQKICRLKDTKGLRYLSFLLRSPGKEIYAGELLSLVGYEATSDVMTESLALQKKGLDMHGLRVDEFNDTEYLLDAQAKAAYRQRLAELREEREEALQFNDPSRVEKIQEEMDFLTKEITAALGLGGRNRKAASASERARLSVTKAIKTALRHIGDNHPILGHHLTATVRTGTFCSYLSDPTHPIVWTC